MKHAVLQRDPSTDQGTFGMMGFDGTMLHSLEEPWVDANHDGLGDPQNSCITAGSYELLWHFSPHVAEIWPGRPPGQSGMCYLVTGVAGRSSILIHPANFAGNTRRGWYSQLLGCISLGMGIELLNNTSGNLQRAVVRSRMACQKFYDWGASQNILLTIK